MGRRLAVVLCVAAACSPRTSPAGQRGRGALDLVVGSARVRLDYPLEDERSARQIAGALPVAVARAERWSLLRVPVTITVHATHEELERAVQRPGHGWLRAWARYGTVDLQSPRTWGLFPASDKDVAELLTHELTHCAMYQAVATETTWAGRDIPLWFREGMASVTAEQYHRRLTPDRLARFYGAEAPRPAGQAGIDGDAGEGGGGDPLSDPEPLYRRRSELVYGTADLAFRFLVARYGEERVGLVLDGMARGDTFPAAFHRAVGIAVEDFEGEFRRYVLWRGWER